MIFRYQFKVWDLKNIFRLYFQLKVFSSLIYFKFNLLRYVLAQKAQLGPFCAQQFDAVYVVLFQKVLGKRSLKAAPNALASKYIARRLATIASHEGLSIGANCDLAASAIALRTHHSTDSTTDLEVQSRRRSAASRRGEVNARQPENRDC